MAEIIKQSGLLVSRVSYNGYYDSFPRNRRRFDSAHPLKYMENTNKIHFIFTGGTIDSHWDGKLDTSIVNSKSVIPDYFATLIIYSDISSETICMKDSRQLTIDDMEKIKNSVENSPTNKIIITHGTYTMPDTAKYLKAHLVRKDRTIIFTGSMIPLKGFESSDAPFNLGYAIAKVEELPPGIYLCMNGKVFNPDEVVKNLSEGKFFSVFDKKQ